MQSDVQLMETADRGVGLVAGKGGLGKVRLLVNPVRELGRRQSSLW